MAPSALRRVDLEIQYAQPGGRLDQLAGKSIVAVAWSWIVGAQALGVHACPLGMTGRGSGGPPEVQEQGRALLHKSKKV